MKEQSEVELIGGIYRRIYAQRIRLDERINSDALSFAAEAFYFRVHAAADDYGIFPATPRICKAETSPLRNCSVTDVAGWLDELEAVGLIRRFDVGAERFGSIGEFLAMQPAGRNGKRVRRYPAPPSDLWESGGIRVRPGESKRDIADLGASSESPAHSIALHSSAVHSSAAQRKRHPESNGESNTALGKQISGESNGVLIREIKKMSKSEFDSQFASQRRRDDLAMTLCHALKMPGGEVLTHAPKSRRAVQWRGDMTDIIENVVPAMIAGGPRETVRALEAAGKIKNARSALAVLKTNLRDRGILE